MWRSVKKKGPEVRAMRLSHLGDIQEFLATSSLNFVPDETSIQFSSGINNPYFIISWFDEGSCSTEREEINFGEWIVEVDQDEIEILTNEDFLEKYEHVLAQ